ncbi:hypothetical protein [Streptomyces sp. NBC_01237]|uniref:hypothetical protein n=1 Tax=Streptomyces sp. NBC_01237 TaxID=2903790 RepID=UPI002DD892DE|nr:hypothetical protein [Streptomyces sp. NBC_01237]WRZ75887.1 hypothetical protein OG251_32045 [Streptomyces sp. NBC_01237]
MGWFTPENWIIVAQVITVAGCLYALRGGWVSPRRTQGLHRLALGRGLAVAGAELTGWERAGRNRGRVVVGFHDADGAHHAFPGLPGDPLGLRPGPAPPAFAPAVVHGVRAVNRDPGLPALDPRSPDTSFAFDLTVVPATGEPYRVTVRHSLDAQNARNSGSMVIEYDPEQPWRVIVPTRVPGQSAEQARGPTLTGPQAERITPRRPEVRVLGLGALIAAALPAAVRRTG